MNEDIPESVDRATRRDLDRALHLAKEHPWLFKLKPIGNVALALLLAIYSIVHLTTMFLIVFGRP